MTSASLCSYSPQQLPGPRLLPTGLPLLPPSVWGEIKFRSKWKIHLHRATDGHINLIVQHLDFLFSSPKSFLNLFLLFASFTSPHPAAGKSLCKWPFGFLTLFKVELRSTITAFRSPLKYVWVTSDETFAQTPAWRILGRERFSILC